MDTELVFKLKQEINKLLEERPELRPLQADITRMLDGAGSKENRAALSYSLMVQKVHELNATLRDLLK